MSKYESFEFQSTHPMRGETNGVAALVGYITFQSTHPMRGETKLTEFVPLYDEISIHSPHAG